MRLTTITLLIALGILTGACQLQTSQHLYEGAHKPLSEIARLTLSNSINLHQIDGMEYSNVGRYIGATQSFFLLPGQHILYISIESVWEFDNEEHEIVKSKPMFISINLDAGQEYTLKHKPLNTLEEAQAFMDRIEFIIEPLSSGQASILIPQTKTRLFNPVPPKVTAEFSTSKKQDSVSKLQTLWQQATEQERQRFEHWIKNNDSSE